MLIPKLSFKRGGKTIIPDGTLRDLFSLKPDLVLYDITSTSFEGAGPQDFAKHGYSRDGKPQNVQVIVGVVMVAGWPIAHHAWAGNRVDHATVQEVIRDLRTRFEFGRLVFVGDRGMVTEENLESITKDKHGFLVGLKRRRHASFPSRSSPIGVNAKPRTISTMRSNSRARRTADCIRWGTLNASVHLVVE